MECSYVFVEGVCEFNIRLGNLSNSFWTNGVTVKGESMLESGGTDVTEKMDVSVEVSVCALQSTSNEFAQKKSVPRIGCVTSATQNFQVKCFEKCGR